MDIATRPHECLSQWLKVSPRTDVTHCILRYDRTLLVTYCGRTIPLKEAARPVLGARHCEICESLHRRLMKERNGHVPAGK
jgi:hypothetical protein